MASGMDAKNFALLSRKLEALNYTDPLEPVSAPLVQKLVDDLVHTTESYRALKLKNAKAGQEVEQWQGKLEVWRKDSERLLHENNALHVQLIKQAERFDEDAKSGYIQRKRLEDQISELAFWKAQHVERYTVLEQENAALRERIHEVLRTGERVTGDPARPKPAPRVDANAAGLVQQAESRVRALERELASAQARASEAEEKLSEAGERLGKRELEIERLGTTVEKGRDIDRLNMEYRNEANESIILQLNQQVEFLTGQVSQLEDEAGAKRQYEAALDSSEKGRSAAEASLRGAVEENRAIRQELLSLQGEVGVMRDSRGSEELRLAGELAGANAAVATLKQELADLKADREALREKLAEGGGAVEAAVARGSELADEQRELKALLDVARGERDRLRSEASAAHGEAGDLRAALREKGDVLLEAERRCAGLQEELDTRCSSVRRMQADKEAAEATAQQVTEQLKALQREVAERAERVSAVSSEAEAAEGTVRRLQSRLAEAEDELDGANKAAAEARSALLQAQAALAGREAEAARLTRAIAAATEEAREAKEAAEAARTAAEDGQREAARLRGELALATEEAELQRAAARDAAAALAAEEARAREGTREREALGRLAPAMEDLRRESAHLQQRLSESEGKVGELRGELLASEGARRQLSQQAEALREELDTAQAGRDALREELKQFESQASSLYSDVSSWKVERARLQDDVKTGVEEAARLREALSQAQARNGETERRATALERRSTAAERDLSAKEAELERAVRGAEAASQAAAAARQREDEARAQAAEAASKATRCQQLAEETEEELSQVRSSLGAEKVRAAEALEELESERKGRHEASVELERMRTVFSQLDSMREELVAKLKSKFAEVKAAEVRAGDLERHLRDARAGAEDAAAEASRLRAVLGAQEQQHDALQGELDDKAERIAALEEEVAGARWDADEARRSLAMAEGRAARADSAAVDAEEEVHALRQQIEVQQQSLDAMQREVAMKSEELRAVMDDLTSVTREQQVVNGELVQAAQERDEARSELRSAAQRTAHLEQLLRARDKEREDLLKVYQELGAEARRLSSTVAQLERDAGQRETHITTLKQENDSLQAALQSTEAQEHQYLLDLQAYERQVDALSRQLARSEGDAEESAKEGRSLAEQLRAAAAVRFELERAREAQGREAAQLHSQIEILKARLQESGMENQTLQSKLQLESSQVRELEGLVARMRAAEHQVLLGGEEVGAKEKALQEQSHMLETQVGTLSKQVTALQDACGAQEKELQRLYRQQGGAKAADQSAEVKALREMQAVAEGRLANVEERNRVLEGQLRHLSDGAANNNSQESGGDVQADNDRLLDLLAKLDSERSALAAEVQRLQSSSQVGGDDQSASGVSVESDARLVSELKAQLQESEGQRKQLEGDFQRLMESVEGFDTGNASGSSGGGSSSADDLDALQRRLREMEAENIRLRANLDSTRASMGRYEENVLQRRAY